jgi:hypothetical protein
MQYVLCQQPTWTRQPCLTRFVLVQCNLNDIADTVHVLPGWLSVETETDEAHSAPAGGDKGCVENRPGNHVWIAWGTAMYSANVRL